MKSVIFVPVIESERGWGSKIDDYMVCLSDTDARIFIDEFNSKNNLDVVPDWYMRAESEYINKDITDEQYEVLKQKNMIWFSELKKTL